MVKHHVFRNSSRWIFISSNFRRHERLMDFRVETMAMPMRFSVIMRKQFYDFFGRFNLRGNACVQTSPFVNLNGEVFVLKNDSWEKIRPNAQTALIHWSTKFEPTIDVSTNFMSTKVLTNSIPPYDYIGRIQILQLHLASIFLWHTQRAFQKISFWASMFASCSILRNSSFSQQPVWQFYFFMERLQNMQRFWNIPEEATRPTIYRKKQFKNREPGCGGD